MVADLMSFGRTMLGRRHVLPSVVSSLHKLMVEGTFPTGTYLVTVHDPIATDDGDLEKALYGSFLPVPSNDIFPLPDASVYEAKKQPGAIVAVKGKAGIITLNEGRKRIRLRVKSMGDRPIQVCHFLEELCLESDETSLIGWFALPLHRDQSAAAVRPHPCTRLPPRYTSGYFCSLRAGRYKDCNIGANIGQQDHQGWKQDRVRLH
jgi:hypothetical protein